MILGTSFCFYLMSVMTLNIFVLRKHRLVFELCHYFILFLSTSGAVSVTTGDNQILVGFKLMSVTVLCSTHGLFGLIQRLFDFLNITVYLCVKFVSLSYYRIIGHCKIEKT